MEIDLRSSSNDLSSAPASDAEGTPGPPNPLSSHPGNTLTAGNFGVAGSRYGHSSSGAAAASLATRQEPQPVKRARKKAEPKDPNAPPAEKKPRARTTKPRIVSATTGATTSRKRTKLEPAEEGRTIHVQTHRAAGLQASTLIQPVSFTQQLPPENGRNEAAKLAESGFTMHDRPMSSYTSPPRAYEYNPTAPAPPPLQYSAPRATPMYDPIRGTTHRPLDTQPPPLKTQPAVTPPRPTYNPSLSPAISGIIDHPPHPDYSNSTTIVMHQPKVESYNQMSGRIPDSPRVNGGLTTGAMDIDPSEKEQAQPKKLSNSRKIPSEASTRATSPKPARAKEQPPPPPMGSGLLSASLFGGDSSNGAAPKDSEKGPNIVLHIDLKDPNNRVINFARMAEEKYGFAALYPRQAAQKERLAKIAAAGAALERSASASKMGGTSAESDEDLSVDIDRDSENDGDVAMSGVNGGQDQVNSGTDGLEPKRRRRRKVEEYDQDDPFVDDSELLWEAQAAASKDGFFVYCGPLVPEGEKPAVERYALSLLGILSNHLLTLFQSRRHYQTWSRSRSWRWSRLSRWPRRRRCL